METTSAETVDSRRSVLVYNKLAYQKSGIPVATGFDISLKTSISVVVTEFLKLSHYE